MSANPPLYDIAPYVAELYDQQQNFHDDIDLIRKLAAGMNRLRILEPFCGTGRIAIPLAQDGHTVTGMDISKGMVEEAGRKIRQLPEEVQSRIHLILSDVVNTPWPTGQDLVILGGNCLYELATAEEQEACIHSAALALRHGGYLYLDNDHMEGKLEANWRIPGAQACFPGGVCADGTRLESTIETVWYDITRRLVRLRRITRVTQPSGACYQNEILQQKHPPSTDEMIRWLEMHGFTIQVIYGNRAGDPYTVGAPRAIFWTMKTGT